MESRKVKILSNTGNLLDEIIIFPIEICGKEHRTHTGDIVEMEGCREDDNHSSTNGRVGFIYEVPDGYREYHLSNGGVRGIQEQLNDWERYLIPNTVHGAWKIRYRQGIVIVKNE